MWRRQLDEKIKNIEFEKEDAFHREKLHNAVYKMAKDVR